MSYRLARFKSPMSVVAKERRKRRRKESGKRCKFSHISQKGEVYFKMTKTGVCYTQQELKKFFGVQTKNSPKIRQRAEERKLIYAVQSL